MPTTVSQRPQTDKTIDLNCITINVNGLTNNSSNPRCSDNNDNKDGFVYTSSTYTDDDGKTYKYNYGINKTSGVYADIIKGANAQDPHRYANCIRSNEKGNEGIINMQKAFGGSQFNGAATKTSDFVYNEGYSKTIGNGKNDKIGNAYNGNGTYTITGEDGTTFYDTQTAAYSNQLIAVRQLPKA